MALGSGYGSKIWINDGVAQAFTELTSPAKITPAGYDVEKGEYINTNQSDRVKRKVPTAVNMSNISAELYYVKNDYARLLAMKGKYFVTGTTQYQIRIIDPEAQYGGTTGTYTANGWVEKLSPPDFEADKLPTFKVEFAVDGDYTASPTPS